MNFVFAGDDFRDVFLVRVYFDGVFLSILGDVFKVSSILTR